MAKKKAAAAGKGATATKAVAKGASNAVAKKAPARAPGAEKERSQQRVGASSVAAPARDAALAPAWAQKGDLLTTATGTPVDNTDNSLRVGPRGPALLMDHHLRDKIMHFDHERIPERVVHARGTGAHGRFQLTDSLAEYTSARVLSDTLLETPVFVRFSTVAGSRGSADTARDVRGFAVNLGEAFRHHKVVAAWGEGQAVLEACGITAEMGGVVVGDTADADFAGRLVEAIGWHRHWDR